MSTLFYCLTVFFLLSLTTSCESFADGLEKVPETVTSMARWERKSFQEVPGRSYIIQLDEVKKKSATHVLHVGKSGRVERKVTDVQLLQEALQSSSWWIQNVLSESWQPSATTETTLVKGGASAKGATEDLVIRHWNVKDLTVDCIQSKSLCVFRLRPQTPAKWDTKEDAVKYARSIGERMFVEKWTDILCPDGQRRDIPVRKELLTWLFQNIPQHEGQNGIVAQKQPRAFAEFCGRANVAREKKQNPLGQLSDSFLWSDCVGWWMDGREIVFYFPKISVYQRIGNQPPQALRTLGEFFRFEQPWFFFLE